MKHFLKSPKAHQTLDLITDLSCFFSIIGIWPRFIEPKLLEINHKEVFFKELPLSFPGLKIAHLSDLHLSSKSPKGVLKKITKSLQAEKPDLICLTGDLLCYSQDFDTKRVVNLLKEWKAPLGTFACLGNHDYEAYVSLSGGKRKIQRSLPNPFLVRALKRLLTLFYPVPKKVSDSQIPLKPHPKLKEAFELSSIQLLHNESFSLDFAGLKLQLFGTPDLWAHEMRAETLSYLRDFDFNITLAHNPDTLHLLKDSPPSLILSGHTHGGQLELPILRRLTRSALQDQSLVQGLHMRYNHTLHISRGIGSPYPLRWNARPELSYLKIQAKT